MHAFLVDLLVCPACHGELTWHSAQRDGARIEQADAHCASCHARYEVRDGIGVFLTPDLARNDLWQAGGGSAWLRERPEAERRLMESPLAELNPADQLLRAFVLEERGDFAAAGPIAADAMLDAYTEEYRRCWESQTRWVLDRLAGSTDPIVDIASGRGYLVEAMARELATPIVASDFSLRVLRRGRNRLRHLGLYDRVSLIAFDARRSPFRDGSVARMTSNLGLANVEQPGGMAEEIRRVLSGNLLSIHGFFPEDDGANGEALRNLGLEKLAFKRTAIAYLESAGLRVAVANAEHGVARPTPRSAITGMPIDLVPVAETVLEWCVLSIT